MLLEKWIKLFLLLVILALLLFCSTLKSTVTIEQKKDLIEEGNTKLDTNTKDINNNTNKNNKSTKSCNTCDKGTCSGLGSNSGPKSCSEGGKSCNALLPVMDPMYNMREICKQSILLEDHLFQKEKRCHDCICKHFLTIEALAEEAITLDKEQKYPEMNILPTKVRGITKKYIDNHTSDKQPPLTAQELREIRKELMQKCFKYF
jgi:hypothetical protein